MSEYKNPVCRGCWQLGNNCGHCERCQETNPMKLVIPIDTQESELTKLRKRVEVLEEALSFYGNPESWIIRDKHSWRKSSPKSHGDDETILTYQHPNRDWVGTVVVGGIRAREALKKSKELGAG